MSYFNQEFEGQYDFLYLPLGSSRSSHQRANLGYCFMNFLHVDDAARFKRSFHGFSFPGTCKVCNVEVSRVQGLAANLEMRRMLFLQVGRSFDGHLDLNSWSVPTPSAPHSNLSSRSQPQFLEPGENCGLRAEESSEAVATSSLCGPEVYADEPTSSPVFCDVELLFAEALAGGQDSDRLRSVCASARIESDRVVFQI